MDIRHLIYIKMDSGSFIICHAFTFTIGQADLWRWPWIDAAPTNYYLPPLCSSPSWTLLKPFITLSLYNSPTNPKITWSASPQGWGWWWWQSVIGGWIPPLNNYYLPVGWESFITLWLYNCAQNTAPPPSTPNMQSSLRSLKYGLTIWRWHGWQITPRAAGTNIARKKATHFRPGELLGVISKLILLEPDTAEQWSCRERKREFIWWQILDEIVR